MKDLVALLSEPGTTIAVVGATDNAAKFGYVIYRDLKRKGYAVFPVNPNRSTVDGDRAYARLRELSEKPGIVNVVVPPSITMGILEECLELGVRNLWLQPGAESPETLRFLQENGFNYLANACIMIESRLNVRRG